MLRLVQQLFRVNAALLARVLRTGIASPSKRTAGFLLISSVICGMFYGAVMGAFGLRPLQIMYSALKVPLLLAITFLISLPSFFVLNTLLGLRGDFARTLAALLNAQTAMTLTLAGLAPLTAVWYCTSGNYDDSILFNGILFALATLVSQVVLRRLYRPLIAVNPMHRRVVLGWIITFAFVGIQMGWVLRPFVGNPATPTHFFREGAWSNAYVFVGRLIWQRVEGERFN